MNHKFETEKFHLLELLSFWTRRWKNHFSSVNQNLQLWMLRIFNEKFLIRLFLRQKILPARNWQSNESWFKNSRHQSLIANWLIKARRFCIITIWCEMKMAWNECGVKWLWGEMNVGWNEHGVKWMWGEMIWGEVIWGEMILGWNERTPIFQITEIAVY